MKIRRNEGTSTTTMMRRSNGMSRTTIARRRDGASKTVLRRYNGISRGWNRTTTSKKSRGDNA